MENYSPETNEMNNDTSAILAAMSGNRQGYDGLGGGLLGGIILGALLGRNGGLLTDSVGNGVNNLQGSIDTTAIMAALGDIKASVPLAESQVQLALAGSTAQLSNNQTQIQLALQAASSALARDIAAVDTNVDRQSTAIQMTIKDDGEKTRALITTNLIADLQRQLGVAQLENVEQRTINREIVNTNTTNVNVNQLQQQQQQQQMRTEWLLSQLCGNVARATNSSVVVGSSGVTGSQTANPTNVIA